MDLSTKKIQVFHQEYLFNITANEMILQEILSHKWFQTRPSEILLYRELNIACTRGLRSILENKSLPEC